MRAGFVYYHNEALAQGAGLEHLGRGRHPRREPRRVHERAHPDRDPAAATRSRCSASPPACPGTARRRPTTSRPPSPRSRATTRSRSGFDVRHNRDFLLQVQDNGGSRGRYQFNAAQTASPTDTASQNGYANAIASFLLDAAVAASPRDLKVTDPGTQHWAVFTFIHDKWQVTPKLTLDLGLRHEYYTPLRRPRGPGRPLQLRSRDQQPAHRRLRQRAPATSGSRPSKDNFAPRTGVSYRFNEKTVLRAGYGVSIIPFPDNQYAFNFPVKQNNQFNPPVSFAPAGSMAERLPAPDHRRHPRGRDHPRQHPAAARTSSTTWCRWTCRRGRSTPGTSPSSGSCPGSFTGEIAYVANRGRGVLGRARAQRGAGPRARQRGAALLRAASAAPPRRTGWSKTNTRYDSMQVKLDRRFSNGLLWTNSYTLSRAKDYVNDNGDHRHPRRRRAQLRPGRLRPHALVRVELRLRAAVPARTRPGADGRDPGRLAGGGRLHRPVRHARRHPRRRGQPARAAEPAAAEPQRRRRT